MDEVDEDMEEIPVNSKPNSVSWMFILCQFIFLPCNWKCHLCFFPFLEPLLLAVVHCADPVQCSAHICNEWWQEENRIANTKRLVYKSIMTDSSFYINEVQK